MKTFQSQKYFEWGSLKLELHQYLEVTQADFEDCLIVTRADTGERIVVSKKAFENQINLGRISEK